MIFPRNNHLRLAMIANFTLGSWPFVFADNPTLRAVYNAYSKFLLAIFAVFVVTTYIEVVIRCGEATRNSQDITGNLSITLLGSMIFLKAVVVRRPGVTKLIREIINAEEMIYEGKDGDVVRIYDNYVARTRHTGVIYFTVTFLVMVSFVFFPFLTEIKVFDEARNRTITIRELPEPAWIPWDKQDHYWAGFSWHIFSGCIAAFNVVFMDIFMFSLIIFPLGQIDILTYHLRNFKKYAVEMYTQLGCSQDEASFFIMRQYVLKHKDIIRYVDDYNVELRYIMVFEFLVSSIQLASIAVQLVLSGMSLFDFLHWGGFAFCMFLRLLVYYWYANEIMLGSSNLGAAIWESDWFEESYKVKQVMLIMITRSQRPLGLEIGPFTTMTLERFLGIVKATYSYVMIMYR